MLMTPPETEIITMFCHLVLLYCVHICMKYINMHGVWINTEYNYIDVKKGLEINLQEILHNCIHVVCTYI